MVSSPFVYVYMGRCQNYGPFLGTLNIRCRLIIGAQIGTIVLTITHVYIYIHIAQKGQCIYVYAYAFKYAKEIEGRLSNWAAKPPHWFTCTENLCTYIYIYI